MNDARWADRLADLLGGEIGDLARESGGALMEVRLGARQPARCVLAGGGERLGPTVTPQALAAIVNRLTDNSLYARERELSQGYFTTADGMRVGVCGKLLCEGAHARLVNVASLCIRVPRQARGCARALFEKMCRERPEGALILSPPRMGKTTLVRDLARLASEAGWNVAIADERREIAACVEGVPTMDVGPRTQVMDGCPKAISIPMLVRGCAPDLLIADEIGGEADAEALIDAARCGVAVAATAHARTLRDARRRASIARALDAAVFRWVFALGPTPGRIASCKDCDCEEEIKC